MNAAEMRGIAETLITEHGVPNAVEHIDDFVEALDGRRISDHEWDFIAGLIDSAEVTVSFGR